MNDPFITIVTPTYNQAETLRETLKSVLAQGMGAQLEYIVVDACSTDSTESLVREYIPIFNAEGVHFRYIREPDEGQSDAINKGWLQANGEICGYINSDDIFLPSALRCVMDYFNTSKDTDWAYGGWRLISRDGCVYREKQPERFHYGSFLNYCDIGQPSCFFRRHLLDRVGFLDTDHHLAMDYHLWMRFADLSAAGIIPRVLSCMRYYGGAKSARFAAAQALEVYRVAASRTSPLSYRRLMQLFYLMRSWAVIFLQADVTHRIERLARKEKKTAAEE